MSLVGLLLIVLLAPALALVPADRGIETNLQLLARRPEPVIVKKDPEAFCNGNSICSFLQANNHGVNVVEYCKCEGQARCSVQWDPYDGKSITQAQSDQFKYCDHAPRVKKCSIPTEVAYTSVTRFRGERKVQSSDKIHCVCPDGHNYLDNRYDFKENGDISEVLVEYFCRPLPPCNGTQICKDVTVKPGQYIVNPKCLCGEGMACPSVTTRGVTRTLLGANMELQQVTCQAPVQSSAFRLLDLIAQQKLANSYRERMAERMAQELAVKRAVQWQE